ncbi:MAG: OmpA/MotB family protein [Myxococcota bacterium]
MSRLLDVHISPIRRFATLRGISSGLALMGLVSSLGGCVTKGTYDELVAERDQLQGQLASTSETLSATQNELAASESVNQDLEGQLEAQQVAVAATAATYSALADNLREELVAGQVVIEQLREGIRVQLSDEVLFESGSANLDDRGREILTSVSGELTEVPYRVEVEGHTDATPIGGRLAQRYQSNWDLAATRATRVVQLLEKEGVAGDRLVAVSYGSTRPVASNDSEEGRAQNRRIEIRLIPSDSATPATGE